MHATGKYVWKWNYLFKKPPRTEMLIVTNVRNVNKNDRFLDEQILNYVINVDKKMGIKNVDREFNWFKFNHIC